MLPRKSDPLISFLLSTLFAVLVVAGACVLGCALPLAQAPAASIQQANPMSQAAETRVEVHRSNLCPPGPGPATSEPARN